MIYEYGICIRCHSVSPDGYYLCTDECQKAFIKEHKGVSLVEALHNEIFSTEKKTRQPRKVKITPAQIVKMRNRGVTWKYISEQFNVSIPTLRKMIA